MTDIEQLKAIAEDQGYSLAVDQDSDQTRLVIRSDYLVSSIHLTIKKDDVLFAYIKIRTSSWNFPGERTDLHDCISLMLSAFLRNAYDSSCGLWDVRLEDILGYGIPTELYARILTIDQTPFPINRLDKQGLEALRELMSLIHMFEHPLWALLQDVPTSDGTPDQNFSYNGDATWASHISSIIGGRASDTEASKVFQAVTRSNPTWKHYRSISSGISVFYSAALADFARLITRGIKWQIIDGINGKLYLSAAARNIISFRNIRRARKLLSILNESEDNQSRNELLLVPLENYFVASEGPYVLAFKRDCGRKRFGEERDRLQMRHKLEAAVLFPLTDLIWSDLINYDDFELLIRDLLAREKGVSWIRKVSASSERDAGRDLLAEWDTPPIPGQLLSKNQSPYTTRRVVVQCKAFTGKVGKSKVQDIRDTVEHHNAQGYFLAVSSHLTSTLTDHLDKLRREGKIWVDWWSRSEIEERLKTNPEIVARYPKIVRRRDSLEFVVNT